MENYKSRFLGVIIRNTMQDLSSEHPSKICQKFFFATYRKLSTNWQNVVHTEESSKIFKVRAEFRFDATF